ncbi:serine protease [Stenotrophomonas phage vB_SmaS_DLP_3]|nr:serine protease [Stenotrophomonas phage vB_SmaS_DLP_3]
MTEQLTIKKADKTYKQMVWAEVYAPNRPDVDGEFMTADEIEKMAYSFIRKGKLDQIDVNHDNKVVSAHIIESFIARKGDPDFIEGAWVVAVHIEDEEAWQMILDGELNGFSMEAMVSKEEVEVTVEIPPVVKGSTTENEDHHHEFFVTFDEQGNFLGGMTDVVKGHSHKIIAGTVTEKSEGHSHRFSSVDNIEIIEDADDE